MIAINNTEELKEWFFQTYRKFNGIEKVRNGIYVSRKVRNETLLSESQGKIIIEGKVRIIDFVDYKDGVYKAYIDME